MKRAVVLLVLLWPSLLVAQTTHTVCASGCDFTTVQAAVNAASYGDTITLAAGETFTEAITLPDKGAGSTYITIKSDASAGNLPGSGVRTSPAYSSFLPKIKSTGSGSPAMKTALGAHHYRIENVEFLANPGGIYDILELGRGDSVQQFISQQPYEIVVDRVLMRGDPVYGMRRGIALHGRDIDIVNSYISGMATPSDDAQAIGCGNGTGGYLIQNNYLEGAAENFICGGSDPWIRTRMTVTGSASTTGAAVQTTEASHTCNELANGYPLAVETSAGVLETTITNISSISGNTCTLTWSAIGTAPAVGQRVRWDMVPDDIQFLHNHVAKPLEWRNSILTKPTGLTATPSTASGTLAAGSYCFRVQAYAIGGGYGSPQSDVRSDVSDEVCTALAGTGKVDLAWTDVTGETSWRVWVFSSSGQSSGSWFSTVTNSGSHDGSQTLTAGTYGVGTRWRIKTLFELKVGTNVVVRGNIFENCWSGQGADDACGAWWKAVNQDGGCWTCRTWDVLVEENIWRRMSGWLLISGRESYSGNPRPFGLRRLTIQNNLFYDSNSTYGGSGCRNNVSNASNALVIDHNTIIHTCHSVFSFGDDTSAGLHTGFVWTNNLALRNSFGVFGVGLEGTNALNTYAPSSTFLNNVVSGANCGIYPATTLCPSQASFEANFEQYSASDGGDFALKSTSSWINAGSDGNDIGADIAAVLAETANVIVGTTSEPPSILTQTLPNALEDISYGTQTISATGGVTPYTWSVVSGSLPAGLSLGSSTGQITGTPTTPGVSTFTVRVTDDVSNTDDQSFTVTIYAAVTVTTSTLPAASIGVSYSQTLAATGDLQPYLWAITAGSLPAWATLNVNTGVVSGSPNASGTSNFTVRATGSLGSQDTQALTITTGTVESTFQAANPSRQLLVNNAAGKVFGGSTAPDCGDQPWWWDLWMDTSTIPAVQKQPATIACSAGSGTVTWTPTTSTGTELIGDASNLTNIPSAELTGTLPADVIPANLTVSTSLTAPTVTVSQYALFSALTCSTLSTIGTARLCYDVSDGRLKISENGAAYTQIGSGGGTNSLPLVIGEVADIAFLIETDQSYGCSFSTTNTRRIAMVSQQGSLHQAFVFGDSSAAQTDTIFCVSTNNGSGWVPRLYVQQDGAVRAAQPRVDTMAAPSCNSTTRGQYNYVAGGAAVADVIQICVKTSSDTYQFVALATVP